MIPRLISLYYKLRARTLTLNDFQHPQKVMLSYGYSESRTEAFVLFREKESQSSENESVIYCFSSKLLFLNSICFSNYDNIFLTFSETQTSSFATKSMMLS